jgi:hypothetical protein
MKWRPRFRNIFKESGLRTSEHYELPMEGPGSNWHKVIKDAIKNDHELELVYQGNNDLKGVQRVIIPTGMGPGRQPGTTALRAFDPNAGVHKEFRTDRIVKMIESRPSSVQPIPEDPKPFFNGIRRDTTQSQQQAESQAPSSSERKPTLGEIVGGGSKPAPVTEAPATTNNSNVKCPHCDGPTEVLFGASIDGTGGQRLWCANSPKSCGPLTPYGTTTLTGNEERRQSGWIVENPTLKSSVNEKTGDIDPTDDEYAELKALDIDPDTHDKATVRRLRNKGATHEQLKEVAGEHGLPLEDYEQALDNNKNNHTLAVQEALGYRSRDEDQLQQNRERNLKFPEYTEGRTLSDDGHEANANILFLHHLNLKNAPEFSGMYKDIPGRRRANEWILSELSKVRPPLKDTVKSKFFRQLETLKGTDVRNIDTENGVDDQNYFRVVNELDEHHGALMATATNLKDLTKQRRIRKALANVGNARFYPNDYTADAYEED